ncbi:MAG: hypothetical protein DWQ06_10715 [Calditrichaeota bacterium]|nr:MAG: hypothetical protein DWQ06_10715 [Calditrichota bacterium]
MLAILKSKNGFLIFLLILFISLVHYSIHLDISYLHVILRRLYYLPVILASLTFGLRGGIFFSGIVTLFYLPHILQHAHHSQSFLAQIDRFIEVGFIFGFSFLIGRFTDYQRKSQKIAEQKTMEIEEQSKQILLLEQKLNFADKLSILGELFATMAHEVRNPLGSIKGVAEILERRFKGSKEVELMQVLNEEVGRLEEVVSNYLTFVKKKPEEKSEVRTRDLLESVVKLLKPKFEKNGFEIKLIYETQEIKNFMIFVDKIQLQQLFLNLILNAFYSLKSGGEVKIEVSQNENSIVFKVVDNGIGVEEENKKKIFDSFFTTRSNGTGLGLSICKKITEEHKGTISFFSEIEKGTTFVITLPIDEKTLN